MSIKRFVRGHLAACVAVGLAMLGTATGIRIATATGDQNDVQMQSVSKDRLAQEGMHLRQPSRYAVRSDAEARSEALSQFPGATIRESALADVQDSNVPKADGRTAWVVSIVPALGIHAPSSGPAGNPPMAAGSFMLLFFDSQTGDFIFGDIGS